MNCTSGTAPSARWTSGRSGPATLTTGSMTYDPALLNTAITRSAITYIDGETGILLYRGYPIEQLAEKLHLPRGGLPAAERRAADQTQLDEFSRHHDPHLRAREHQVLHRGLPLRRPPDGHAGVASVGALSTFYPEAKKLDDKPDAAAADAAG